ncbi:ABC transporter permease [Flavitalea sp.]|nr:FtsX-like permease family protein [Flavitalea sp.]
MKTGCYTEPDFKDIISLDMIRGGSSAFTGINSILIDESLSKTLFGHDDPINKVVKLNSSYMLKVVGVYKDLPDNSRFSDFHFITGIDQLFADSKGMDNWFSSAFSIYGLLNEASQEKDVSAKIENILFEHSKDATKPVLFLYPMSQWRLYDFKNGNLVSGRLQFVWLFGIIAVFVLLLACINFMNLSTARSEKRAREVGIRKTIGAGRSSLVGQFFSESFAVVFVSFLLTLLLVELALPGFNELSGKQLDFPWTNSYTWLISLSFCLFTAILAGSYPAIYLSSFQPVKVLKGTFRAGRCSSAPRKMLVVLQFTVSIILIIGTIIVFRQIEFAKDRPIGYDRNNVVSIPYNPIQPAQYVLLRNKLLESGAVTGVSASSSPATGIFSSAANLDWKGKDPNRQEVFGTILVDPDFGDVLGWKLKEGRNFSRNFLTDSSAFLFNEAAIKQMGLEHPVGETVKWHGRNWTVIGVVKDMVMRSPFDPIVPTVFLMDDKERSFNVINMKINPSMSASESLARVEAIYKELLPETPFTYKFADQEYSFKFASEERIGKLALVFTTLAIFISCLGLFGMASFVAEQRTKEIGVRKVIGASVFDLWAMLSKEFVLLVTIACVIAMPLAYYFLQNWLVDYAYHTKISWWIFFASGVGSILLTLVTVSYQSIKAALMNPVKSLRSE